MDECINRVCTLREHEIPFTWTHNSKKKKVIHYEPRSQVNLFAAVRRSLYIKRSYSNSIMPMLRQVIELISNLSREVHLSAQTVSNEGQGAPSVIPRGVCVAFVVSSAPWPTWHVRDETWKMFACRCSMSTLTFVCRGPCVYDCSAEVKIRNQGVNTLFHAPACSETQGKSFFSFCFVWIQRGLITCITHHW